MTAPTLARPEDGQTEVPLSLTDHGSADVTDGEAPTAGRDAERRATLLGVVAAAVATASAAWVLSGVFPGWAPRALALVASVLGPAFVGLSLLTRRTVAVQLGGIGAVLVLAAGAGLVGAEGDASLVQRIDDALRGGGLAQAPVAFDPGWRVVLVVVVGLLGVAAAGLASSTGKPRLAVAITAPLLAAGTLVQPAGAEVVSAAVGLALVIASLGVAAAADLVRQGASSGRLELRRAGSGAGILALLLVALVAASQVGALLPPPRDDVVVPPQRPQPSPPLGDRDLFRVTSERPQPWRLGTLDVYDGTAWLTPPFDPGRFEDLGGGGSVPTPSAPAGENETVEASFEVLELTGRALPALANPLRVTGEELQVDPRTQVLRVPAGRTSAAREYTVVATAPPTGDDLAAAPEPGPGLAPFLEVPPPPPEVADLIEALPDGSDFDRLQAARETYYSAVVAAGPGDPVDVPPERVAELLDGREGSPFEISAGEAVLARWVGVPSRLGYGWFGGDTGAGDGTTVVRPEHGATWLEVWFEGHGWVPIVGKPPRAKSSVSNEAKDEDPSVRPTDRLTVFTYVPVRLQGLRQVTEVVRWWALRIAPVVLGLIGAIVLLPAAVKWQRRRRRRRWAAAGPPEVRLEAAYAELRDLLTDLGVGRPSQTPLQALDAVDPDDEHRELAWLVTRGLWGDLRRDLTDDDAAVGAWLAASVRRRLLRALPMSARATAALSRASLRQPWSTAAAAEVTASRLRALARWPADRGAEARRWMSRRPRWQLAAGLAALVAVVAAAVLPVLDGDDGAGQALPPPGEQPLTPLPEPLVPAGIGDVVIDREPAAEVAFAEAGDAALVGAARVYSVRIGDDVEGSLQAGVLRPGVSGRADEVAEQVLRSLAGGGFEPTRFGRERGYALMLPEQQLLLWFTPDLRAYQLLVARASYDGAPALFEAILAGQRGVAAEGVEVPQPDPRRGLG